MGFISGISNLYGQVFIRMKGNNNMNKNVRCIPFVGIKNAYMVISGYKEETGNGVKKCMSFFYDNGDIGAEWEPDNGPITVIYKCNKAHEKAEKHWFYDYCTGYGNWSQLAVESEGLPNAFLTGAYDYLFAVLKKWASNQT